MIWLLLALSGGGTLDYSDPAMWLIQPGQPEEADLWDATVQVSVDGQLQVLADRKSVV